MSPDSCPDNSNHTKYYRTAFQKGRDILTNHLILRYYFYPTYQKYSGIINLVLLNCQKTSHLTETILNLLKSLLCIKSYDEISFPYVVCLYIESKDATSDVYLIKRE